MQHENTSLRATISRQSQKIGRMENELKKNEMLLKDQGGLQSTVDKQREKIVKYQREIEETKLHMARLEDLVHQVQEQSMKEHVTTTPSVSVLFVLQCNAPYGGHLTNFNNVNTSTQQPMQRFSTYNRASFASRRDCQSNFHTLIGA